MKSSSKLISGLRWHSLVYIVLNYRLMRRGRRADKTKNSPLASTVPDRFTSSNFGDQLILLLSVRIAKTTFFYARCGPREVVVVRLIHVLMFPKTALNPSVQRICKKPRFGLIQVSMKFNLRDAIFLSVFVFFSQLHVTIATITVITFMSLRSVSFPRLEITSRLPIPIRQSGSPRDRLVI